MYKNVKTPDLNDAVPDSASGRIRVKKMVAFVDEDNDVIEK